MRKERLTEFAKKAMVFNAIKEPNHQTNDKECCWRADHEGEVFISIWSSGCCVPRHRDDLKIKKLSEAEQFTDPTDDTDH